MIVARQHSWRRETRAWSFPAGSRKTEKEFMIDGNENDNDNDKDNADDDDENDEERSGGPATHRKLKLLYIASTRLIELACP